MPVAPPPGRLAGPAAAVAALAMTFAISGASAAIAGQATAPVPEPEAASLFVDWESTTLKAAEQLSGQARDDAVLLGSFPSGTWFTSGTPAQVQAAVDEHVSAAEAEGAVPLLVAYYVPYRDCAQYSAGGAADTAEYTAWIDAFAAGIGDRDAYVVLEPDGLGIIPWYTTVNGDTEWCQPAEADPATAADERFTQLNHAVDALAALPSTKVYLDGTHNGWLGVGDATDRLIKAGVERADGFFLNASNYQATENVSRYAGWISDCIALSTQTWYEPAWCASQYYPANPDDLSTWHLTDAAYDAAFADTGLTRDRAAQKHALIDTSRNGQGPWTAPAGKYTDAEVWCNPPGRGLGLRPTLQTGDPVIDGYVWIKVPGESDGKCYRGTGGPLDPERGIEDPAAGAWFPEQAAELIALAVPPVEAPACRVKSVVHGSWPGGFIAQVWVTNTGTEPLAGWDLRFALTGGARIVDSWNVDLSQDGQVVDAGNLRWNARVAPGSTVTFGYVGSGASGDTSLLRLLDGRACSVG